MNEIPQINSSIINLKGELWKQYRETDYYVSNYGRVKRRYIKSERLLNPYKKTQKKGPHYFLVKVNNKATKVHSMVYESFVGLVPKGYVIIHRNRVQSDNALVNLKLVTAAENGKANGGRNSRRRLIYDIDNKVFYKGTREAAKALYISRQTVSDYCNNKRKKPVVRLRWAREDE